MSATKPETKPKTLNTFVITMMTLGLIVGIPVVSDLAEDGPFGLLVITFGLFAVFLPSALICSELGTAFPHDGGVYLWVREAFGPRLGFLALWYQWTDQIVFLSVSLSVAAASSLFMFSGSPNISHPSRLYTGAVIMAVIWFSTFLNLFGVKGTSVVATIGVWLATIVPAIVIILAGVAFFSEHSLQQSFALSQFIPPRGALPEVVPGYTAFLALEVTAVYVRRMKRPSRTYPRAIFAAGWLSYAILGLVAFVIMGSISSATLGRLSSEAGIMSTVQHLLGLENTKALVPLVAGGIVLGWVGLASNIFMGPATGLLATARYGHLPEALARVNSKGAPRNLLIVQAVISTVVSSIFLLLADSNQAFTIIVSLATAIYICMYLLMFASAWRLRVTRPSLSRPFRVKWLPGVAVFAIVMAVFVLVMTFVPPSGFERNRATYLLVMLVAFPIAIAAPILVDRRTSNTLVQVSDQERVDFQEGEQFLDSADEGADEGAESPADESGSR